MKIAQVCHSFPPYIGGIEKHVEEISKRLARRGWSVEVVTARLTKDLARREKLGKIKVIRFPSLSPSNAYHLSIGLPKYIEEKNYDVVHVHGYHALPAHQVVHVCDEERVIFTPHYKGFSHSPFRSFLHKLFRPIGKTTFLQADKVICVSDYEKDKILRDFNIPERKITLIPNGVNLEEFREVKSQASENTKKTILCVSRLEKYKGIQYLIKALPQLPPTFQLEVVGTGSYKEILCELAKNLGVRERVAFSQHIPRNELIQKYRRADLFALLSKYEAYGVVVAEALASHTPCIVANTTGLTEWIDGRSCFGINYPPAIEELSSLISDVISLKGVPLHSRLTSWEEVVDKLEALYYEGR